MDGHEPTLQELEDRGRKRLSWLLAGAVALCATLYVGGALRAGFVPGATVGGAAAVGSFGLPAAYRRAWALQEGRRRLPVVLAVGLALVVFGGAVRLAIDALPARDPARLGLAYALAAAAAFGPWFVLGARLGQFRGAGAIATRTRTPTPW